MNIEYQGGYKYQLLKDYSIWCELPDCKLEEYIQIRDNILTVYRGYAWDGPSGPTVDTSNFMRGSLVHDAMYQLMEEGVLHKRHKNYSDKALYDICRQDGMSWFRAMAVYWAVRVFGTV